jgi:hypothetical protein
MKSFTWCDEIITFTVVIYMTMKKAIMAAIVAALKVSDSYKYTHQITPLRQVVVVFKFLYWARLCYHIYSCNLECCAIMAAVYVNGIRIRRLIYNTQKLILLRLQVTSLNYYIRLFTGQLVPLNLQQ